MVISRTEGDYFRHSELGQLTGVGTLPLSRVIDRPDADYGPLPGHQPRHRLHRAQSARVGYRYGRAGEVAHVDLSRTHLADKLLVGPPELAEIEGVGLFDNGHHKRSGPVGPFEVYGNTEVDVGGPKHGGRGILVGARVVRISVLGRRIVAVLVRRGCENSS